MRALLQSNEAQWVIGFALLAMLVAVGVYLIAKVRELYFGESSIASEQLTEFRQLHRQGMLSDEEFKHIKGKLAAKLHEEFAAAPPAEEPAREED